MVLKGNEVWQAKETRTITNREGMVTMVRTGMETAYLPEFCINEPWTIIQFK